MIVAVDVVAYGDPRRADLDRVAIRQGLYHLLELAFTRSGIPWAGSDREDCGDGVLVLVAATVPKSVFADSFVRNLGPLLEEHNSAAGAHERIRLRVALHAGEVHYDAHGVAGTSVNLAFRLLDAPALKDAVASSAAAVAVIASSWFFEEVVWHSRAAERHLYRRVGVNVKETSTVAWIRLEGSAGPPPPEPVRPAAGGHAVPHQLPMKIPQFVGRHRELALLAALRDGSAGGGTVVITAIDGSAGIGKTTLALHWAHRVKDRFPDGQLYVDLHGFDPREPRDAGQVLHGFLLALGLDAHAIPLDQEARSALYRGLVAERRLVIVLDNARSADHVRPLLPAGTASLVLVTSRRRLDGLVVREGAHSIALDVLSPEEARSLLAERVGRECVDSEPEAAAELAELCQRLPLALSIVAARAARRAGRPLSGLVRELRGERRRLDVLDLGEADLSLRSVFSWSYEILSEEAARLFRLLAVHPGPDIDRHACAAVVRPSADAGEVLTELTSTHLVAEHVPGRYRFHDLLRAYATELTQAEPRAADQHEAARQFIEYYLRAAELADCVIQPCRNELMRTPQSLRGRDLPAITTYEEAIRWFGDECATLLAVVAFAAEQGFAALTWRLALACTTFLRRSGRWHERVAVHQIALAAARSAGDVEGQATASRDLGPALARLGHAEQALGHLQEAAALFGELGHCGASVATHLAFARVLEPQGRPLEAFRHAHRAWRLVRNGDNLLGHADTLNAMGRQLHLLGHDQVALPLCERALGYYTTVGHSEGRADVLINIGVIERRLGRPARALRCFQDSLEIDQRLGDRYWTAHALEQLGDTQHAVGDFASAERAWQECRVILEELKHEDVSRVARKLTALPT
ncbi:tetratricopeptide repeat protein [Amycolatopsis sp. NPDC051102]|uniref:tetratricopeptide repeat protein n=1 Tax=Amycolatopsis sp. NPDC051102 TaxID=3155163 RepID=UPI00341B24B9